MKKIGDIEEGGEIADKKQKIYSSDESILLLFYTKNKLTVKKENIRVQIIRALKRSIRGKSGKLYCISLSDNKANAIWKSLRNFVCNNNILDERSLTENGPKTDGKFNKKKERLHKSYNKDFCTYFFQPDEIKLYYSYFIELIFSNFTAQALSKKFGITCCSIFGAKHTSSCILKWLSLKNYLSNTFIKDLSLTPIHQSTYYSLPLVEEILKF